MNISFNPSFTSRNKNIRKADDILRKAREAFPATSATYIDSFYKTAQSTDSNKSKKANMVAYKYDKFVGFVRKQVHLHSYEGATEEEKKMNAPIFQTLTFVEIAKAANCHEYASIATAGLTANGIYDNERVHLALDIQYKNKETGEIEYHRTLPIDHTAIKTRIGKDDIIVDAWLGMADSLSGASAKYKQLLLNKDIDEEIKIHRSLFRLEKSTPNNIIDPDNDYELKTSIKYIPVEYSDPETMKEIGYFSRCFYPDLCLKW